MNEAITVRLYGGAYIVTFNPRAHRYKVEGFDAIPDGVTTICNSVVPKYLDDWAGRVCVDHVRAGYLAALERGEMLEQSAFLSLCDEAETTHQRLRDGAGDRGSKVHDTIEAVLMGEDVLVPELDPMVAAGMAAFYKWQKSGHCEVMETERIIFSRSNFYCGKCDVYGMVDGKPAIVDFKTGSGFYDEHPYQLCGYAVALEEELEVEIDMGYIVHLDKRDANYKIYPVELNDGMKDAWLAAVRHYKHLKRIRKMVQEMKNGMAKSRIGSKAEAR